jgi:hypothetical protein
VIPFLLYLITQFKILLFFLNEICQRHLYGAAAAKAVELVHFSLFSHQCGRGNTVTHFPSGAVIGFAKGKTNKASLHQFRITK